jgi:hypothetical protein
MARLKKLIKTFEFTEDNRSRLVIGANTRLNPDTHRFQLLAGATGLYPTTADLAVRTWVATPRAVKAWAGFQVVATNVLVDGAPVTSLGYRLNDGTNQWHWNGAAWAISTTLWNTEAEVAANIGDFPATARALGVVINLRTTDPRFTPEVTAVKVLYEAQIEFQRDLVISLLQHLKENVRGISEATMAVPGAVPLAAVTFAQPSTPYNIVGIDSVYNHTDDPDHMEDLFGAYDAGTRVITLLDAVDSGKTLWIRFLYQPEVAHTTGRVYTEVGKVPALTITDINLRDSQESGSGDDEVINNDTGAGWRVPAPFMADIEFVLRCLTDKAGDQMVLADECKRFFRNNPLIVSRGMDEPFRLWLLDEYQGEGVTTQEEVQAGRLRARIMRALFFDKPASEVFATRRLVITGTPDVIVS